MQRLQPYFFAEVSAHIESLRAAGRDVIRLDIGAPDMPPAPDIVAALVSAAGRADTHGYQPYKGTPELRAAWAHWYQREFAVQIDPETQIMPLLGSKEGIFHLTQALVDDGDVVLAPDPGYPTYRRAADFAGAEIFLLPLRTANAFLPDLDAIPAEVAQRAKLMWLNYPNNPTGAVVSHEFLEHAVAFAMEHDVLLVHDAPYSHVVYDGYTSPSILQVAGATDVAVELCSLSKSHNMAGLRVGAAVGNEAAVHALYVLKTNIDTGHYLPVMEAATQALTGDQSWIADRNAVYRARRDLLVETLNTCGFSPNIPRASLYIWAGLPDGNESALFTRSLLDETGVSLAPGIAFGKNGEGFVRVALGADTARVKEACARLRDWAA